MLEIFPWVLKGNKKKSLRNWPNRKSWDSLCESLEHLKIASVGIKELSYAPQGTDDLRGIGTEELCSILASSKCLRRTFFWVNTSC